MLGYRDVAPDFDSVPGSDPEPGAGMTSFEVGPETPAADAEEQRRVLDPVELAEASALPVDLPTEADSTDVLDQADAVSLPDDEF